MMAPFQPLGEVSRRQMVVDLLGDQPEGTLVTYEQLEQLLDVDRQTCQGAVNQAKLALEREHSKAVVSVRGVGYRIVHASEHLAVARVHQGKARKQLVKSRSKVDYVDLSKLTEGERAAVVLAGTAIGLQLDYMKRNDIRSTRIEAAVELVKDTAQRSEEEIAELKARLARLEESSNQDDPPTSGG